MQASKVFIAALMLNIVSLLTLSCHQQIKYHPGGPYYYESFANYEIPFHPVDEITIEKAEKLNSYYIAYFNDEGRIISFEKILYGKRAFTDHYYYRADGTLSGERGQKKLTKLRSNTLTRKARLSRNRKCGLLERMQMPEL